MEKKALIAVLLFFVIPCHALCTMNAYTLSVPVDTVKADLPADSLGRMIKEGVLLKEVVIEGNSGNKEIQMRLAQNTLGVTRQYVEDNFGGSLMQTLERLPGVKAMSIGSGASKPVIRGLGFNRVLVAENGIRHEGQQWGDDHGLETDQYAVDKVEIIKGPAAVTYGSDAIGGVINLISDRTPQERFRGGVNLFARSNNESVGTTLRLAGRNGGFWCKVNATFIDYADYRIPTDSIRYYSYYIKLHDRRLRNTAGHELDGSLLLGYEGNRMRGYFRVADVNTRSGFFANAHGLEVMLSDIDYDRSRRDVDLPYHTVNHLMLSNHTEWHWHGGTVEGGFAYQHNRQSEYSEPVSHGYMPIPPNTLERRFTKQTASTDIRLRLMLGLHSLQAGLSTEYQKNRRSGWGFILPDFGQLTFGGYAYDRFVVSDDLILSAGIRFDHGTVRIHSYHDWYKTPQADGDSVFVERSADMRRSFNSFTWSVGINRRMGDWVLKINAGKSFRIPAAKELGMDGINYNIFRYEEGNAGLKPEESYQADAGLIYGNGTVDVSVTPYLNYFPNYIYLNPTSEYCEGLQLYRYTQCRVLRWGLEASLSWRFLRHFDLEADGQYLYVRQLSGEKKGYSLPYSTPWSALMKLRYSLPANDEDGSSFMAVECRVVGAQNEVVPPEEPTPGHWLLGASAGKSFHLGGSMLRVTLRCENILNKRYYDHTNYYRLIGVPEPGRNFSLMAAWSF